MKENYTAFKKYRTLEQALELKELLAKYDIESNLGENASVLDEVYTGTTIYTAVELQLKSEDFEKANIAIEKENELLTHDVDPDYYLFEFSNEELYEIIIKSDEWGDFDYALAQKLLAQRGKPIDNALISALKEERLKDLKKPAKGQGIWIVLGYFLALSGGFLGLLIGYSLFDSQNILPNGQKVYTYSEKDRFHGKNIFFIGIAIGIILVLYTVLG